MNKGGRNARQFRGLNGPKGTQMGRNVTLSLGALILILVVVAIIF